jgi:hypothetical protein
VPEASIADVIANAGDATVNDTVADLLCAGLEESLTEAVKLKVPLTVGVPLIMPVEAARLSP